MVFLINENSLPIRVERAVYKNKTYHNLKQLLKMINYSKYGSQICADLKVIPLLVKEFFLWVCLFNNLNCIKRAQPHGASCKSGKNLKNSLEKLYKKCKTVCLLGLRLISVSETLNLRNFFEVTKNKFQMRAGKCQQTSQGMTRWKTIKIWLRICQHYLKISATITTLPTWKWQC